MFSQGKLVFSILALSLLGLVLLSSVLFDSYQQSSERLQVRNLEAYSRSLAAALVRQGGENRDAIEPLLEAAGRFVSEDYFIFLTEPSGILRSAGESRIWQDEAERDGFLDAVRSENSSGFMPAGNANLVWSKADINGSRYGLVVVYQEYDKRVARFIREFGVPLFVTIIVFLWITTWAALILGSLFKKLNSQKTQLEEQATKIAQARDRALEASTAKSRFLANMSHEIRTPLTAIIGFSESLLSSDQSPEEKIGSIRTINDSGKHLLHVINEILDFSKIEADRLEVDLVQVSPVQIVGEIEPLARLQASEKGLDFDINYNFPIPETVTTDPTRLKQILLNLVSNAIKFTEQGSIRIEISCAPDRQEMSFEVIDTGIGMDAEQSRKVFEAFTQADTSITREYGGTGLGLTLSRRLSEILGGGLSLQSKPGLGSRFTVTIDTGPLDAVTLLYRLESTPAEEAPGPRGRRMETLAGSVLVAEDNPANQKLLQLYVGNAGCSVTVAEDGRQALDCALSNEFDIIFMDMQMPVMGGLEATAELRKRGYSGAIIALTANTTPADRALCLQAGCDDFLAKPINRDRFLEVLGHYLSSGGTATGDELPVISQLTNNGSGLAHLVEGFLDYLPGKMEALNEAARQEDWDRLKEEAHQLKGAGGGYGYPELSQLAGKLESRVLSGNRLETDQLMDALNRYCQRIYAGAGRSRQLRTGKA